jgi:hydroxymethylglutaryl-CoA reductase (NADPH)
MHATTIPHSIQHFEAHNAQELYQRFVEIIALEYDDKDWKHLTTQLQVFINELKKEHDALQLPKTIIHNDFNSRNIAIRTNGEVCIYDWELAVWDFPHRDIVEFLSFVLPPDFDSKQFYEYLHFHYQLQADQYQWEDWKAGYSYALKAYLITRVSFYMTGKIMVDYPFAERIFLNAFRMIEMLQKLNPINFQPQNTNIWKA